MRDACRTRQSAAASLFLVVLALISGCSSGPPSPAAIAPRQAVAAAVAGPGPPSGAAPATEPRNLYAGAGPDTLSAVSRAAKPLVYVPHNSGDVWVIDPATFAVVGTYRLGGELQHMVPSHDLSTLYASDDTTNKLTPFDPRTGRPGPAIPVTDPYNLYFTPDGRSAISVAEARRRLVFYDPRSWRIQSTLAIPGCAGIDHADFTADGATAVFTCEFAGRVAVVDLVHRAVARMIDMPTRNTTTGPQDIRLSPDGSVFYIADSQQGGLWVLNGAATRVEREIRTGRGAHGLYFSRDAKRLFVTNRLEGSVSVLDAYTGAPMSLWKIPGGGSPDMGNLTADGTQLWVSGRYDSQVYVLSTADGRLLKKIRVGRRPHGLTVWPQPGSYSLGHTGITR